MAIIAQQAPREQDPARSLLRELRGYLDPDECGAHLCICGNADGDPCPLCRFVRQMVEVLTVPLSPFAPGMDGQFMPATITLEGSGLEVHGEARIRENGWVDVEVSRPPNWAGLRSYPPQRIKELVWSPDAWETNE